MRFINSLIILLAVASTSAHSPLCEFCKNAQSFVFDLGARNLEMVLNLASKVCQIKSSKELCDYFVGNFGSSIFHNKRNFLEATNYLCANTITLCSNSFTPFSVDGFKREVDQRFPRQKNLIYNKIFKRKIQNRPFKALVLNDIHLQSDYKYKTKAECGLPGGCCSSKFGEAGKSDRQARYWGTPGAPCDAPDYLFYQTIDFINHQLEKPDLVLMLGDNTGHNYFMESEEVLVDSTSVILKKLKESFPDVPIVPVLGNHECHHVDYFDFNDKSNFVVEKIYPLFEAVISREKINDLINNGFFSQEYADFNLKVISLNSQINDAFNIANFSFSTFFQEFLYRLAGDLYASEQKGQKVIVVSHIPITDYFAIDEVNRGLVILLERFKDSIIGVFSGHTHNDQLRFIRDSKNDVFMVNYLSPSLTTFASYNPSFRMYEFIDGRLSDYIQYKFNIDYYNDRADAGIFDFKYDVAYRFTEEYELKDALPSELQRLFDRLRAKDRAIVSKYVKNYYCLNENTRTGDLVEIPLCELSDDLNEIMSCMGQLVSGQSQTEFISLFRALFVGKILVPSGAI